MKLIPWPEWLDSYIPYYEKQRQEARFLDNPPAVVLQLSLGYIKIGQVNLAKSFGTTDFFSIMETMSKHLDIYKIKINDTDQTYDYVWSDKDYKKKQIDFLRPGYDWSRQNA